MLIGRAGKVTGAVRVCSELTPQNRGRELGSLTSAMSTHGLESGTILTYHQEETVTEGDASGRVLPAGKWLIGYQPGCARPRALFS